MSNDFATTGRPPSWLTKSGSGLLFFVLLLLLITGYLIRYPEIISVDIVLKSATSPAVIESRTSGTIKLMDSIQKSFTTKGTILGYIKKEIDYEEVARLENFVQNIKKTDHNLTFKRTHTLGAFNIDLEELNASIIRLNSYLGSSIEVEKIRGLNEEIRIKQNLLEHQTSLIKNEQEKLDIEYVSFKRDSTLYTMGVISEKDYQLKRQQYLTAKLSLGSMTKEKLNQILGLQLIKYQITELTRSYAKQIEDYEIRIQSAKQTLLERIDTWKYNQLLVSPIEGSVYVHRVLNDNQNVREGEELMYILPLENDKYCLAYVNHIGFGKVKLGQKVVVKLNDFPFQEFGTLEGEISDISPIFTKQGYLIRINLVNGLSSSYGLDLNFSYEMSAKGDIIIDNARLIERIFYQFKYLAQNSIN